MNNQPTFMVFRIRWVPTHSTSSSEPLEASQLLKDRMLSIFRKVHILRLGGSEKVVEYPPSFRQLASHIPDLSIMTYFTLSNTDNLTLRQVGK